MLIEEFLKRVATYTLVRSVLLARDHECEMKHKIVRAVREADGDPLPESFS